jgi:hypothetical protein
VTCLTDDAVANRLAARTGPGWRAELLDIARLARSLAGSGTSLS